MSQGPSAPVLGAPPAPPLGELPPVEEPPVLLPDPPTLPLPPTPDMPPAPGEPPAPTLPCSSMVPVVGYSVLCGVTETLPPEAQYEYGVSSIATARVRLLPSVL